MPEYLYSDGEHRRMVGHGMFDDPPVFCADCGKPMHRVPQPVAVTWGGNPPSRGGLHPLVEELNATRDKRRDEFARKKEEHEKRTKSNR